MNVLVESAYINQPLDFPNISYGKIWVDTHSYIVTYEGTKITLLPQEYKLLLLFLKYPNHVLSYEVIAQQLWQTEKCPTPSTIRSHIKGLRKAFKTVNSSENLIETVHGFGYRLKTLENRNSHHPIISPSLSMMTTFLKAKAIEYAVINDQFMIKYISPGLADYCDYPEFLKLDIPAGYPFPELIGYEEILGQIINEESENFEIKGVARAANPNRPDYINLYIIPDKGKKTDLGREKLLFIFFEDSSEHMIYRQRIVQIENELCLKLELDPLFVRFPYCSL